MLATSSFSFSLFSTYNGSSSASFMSQSFVRWRCGCLKSNFNNQLANQCSVFNKNQRLHVFVLDPLGEALKLQWCLRDPHKGAQEGGGGEEWERDVPSGGVEPPTRNLQANVSTKRARSRVILLNTTFQ